MNSIFSFFAIGIFAFFSTTTAVDQPDKISEADKKPLTTLSGTINIDVDGGFITHSYPVTGTAGVNNIIRKLYVGNNSSEGLWSGSGYGTSSVCVEDSSPHEIRVEYTPTSSGFVINLEVDTTYSPTSYCY
jgi:hypothetical protein